MMTPWLLWALVAAGTVQWLARLRWLVAGREPVRDDYRVWLEAELRTARIRESTASGLLGQVLQTEQGLLSADPGGVWRLPKGAVIVNAQPPRPRRDPAYAEHNYSCSSTEILYHCTHCPVGQCPAEAQWLKLTKEPW